MTATRLLADLHRQHIAVAVDDDGDLCLSAHRGQITPSMVDAVRELKPEIEGSPELAPAARHRNVDSPRSAPLREMRRHGNHRSTMRKVQMKTADPESDGPLPTMASG